MTEQQYDTHQESDQRSQESRPQSQFDSVFETMRSSSSQLQGFDVTTQIVQAYFDGLETQTRTARRISEVWATQMILQQSVNQIIQMVAPEVKRAVLDEVRRNPELLKSSSKK